VYFGENHLAKGVMWTSEIWKVPTIVSTGPSLFQKFLLEEKTKKNWAFLYTWRVRIFEICQWIMKLGTKILKHKSICCLWSCTCLLHFPGLPLFSWGFPHFEVRVRVFETSQWIMKLGTKRMNPKSISHFWSGIHLLHFLGLPLFS
jgi:hypothetical protein